MGFYYDKWNTDVEILLGLYSSILPFWNQSPKKNGSTVAIVKSEKQKRENLLSLMMNKHSLSTIICGSIYNKKYKGFFGCNQREINKLKASNKDEIENTISSITNMTTWIEFESLC